MHLPVRDGCYLHEAWSDEGRQVRKNSPDGDTRRFIVILGGRLSEAGTGRQLLARAKDEPWPICFRFVDKHRASNVRTRDTFPPEPEEKGQDLFPTLTPGPVPSSPRYDPSRYDRSTTWIDSPSSNPCLARVQTLFTFFVRVSRGVTRRERNGVAFRQLSFRDSIGPSNRVSVK